MAILYPDGGDAAPFVPSSAERFLALVSKLQETLPEFDADLCREAVAHALGWDSSEAVLDAIADGQPPSLMDEQAGPDEARRRWGTQLAALADDLDVFDSEAEGVLCQLALTCSESTAREILANTGPWGRHVETPTQLADGIVFGPTGRFRCYRLSPAMQAKVPPYLRLDAGGWYEASEHEWRVMAAFPQLFPKDDVEDALAQAEKHPGRARKYPADYAGEQPVIA